MSSQSLWRPVKQWGRWHSGVSTRLWINPFWSPELSNNRLLRNKRPPPPASCNPVTTPRLYRPSTSPGGGFPIRHAGWKVTEARFVLSDRKWGISLSLLTNSRHGGWGSEYSSISYQQQAELSAGRSAQLSHPDYGETHFLWHLQTGLELSLWPPKSCPLS